jgi:hypothetical protein
MAMIAAADLPTSAGSFPPQTPIRIGPRRLPPAVSPPVYHTAVEDAAKVQLEVIVCRSRCQYGVVSGMDAATKIASLCRRSQTRAVPCPVRIRTWGNPSEVLSMMSEAGGGRSIGRIRSVSASASWSIRSSTVMRERSPAVGVILPVSPGSLLAPFYSAVPRCMLVHFNELPHTSVRLLGADG